VFQDQPTPNRFNDRGRRPVAVLGTIVALLVIAMVILAIVAWNGRDRTSALDEPRTPDVATLAGSF